MPPLLFRDSIMKDQKGGDGDDDRGLVVRRRENELTGTAAAANADSWRIANNLFSFLNVRVENFCFYFLAFFVLLA